MNSKIKNVLSWLTLAFAALFALLTILMMMYYLTEEKVYEIEFLNVNGEIEYYTCYDCYASEGGELSFNDIETGYFVALAGNYKRTYKESVTEYEKRGNKHIWE